MNTQGHIPHCIGVIMDGNRRWAKAKGLPTFQGHARGREVLKDFLTWCKEAGVRNVVSFAFSTENWNRSPEEVSFLLDLIRTILKDERENFIKEKVCVRFVGDISRFPQDIQEGMKRVTQDTEEFTDLSLFLALSYGGRDEIVHAVNECIREGINPVTVADMSAHMYTYPMPDPDLIIRTSGEMRTSGFLPWQGVYSELFFTDTLWPDFSQEEFKKILEEYSHRERRMGK